MKRGTWLVAIVVLAASGCSVMSSASRDRRDQFDVYWSELDEHHPYFDRQSISWPARREQFRVAATFAERDLDFFHIVAGMVSELDDPHVSFRIPQRFVRREGLAGGSDLGREFVLLHGRLYVNAHPDDDELEPPSWLDGTDRALPELVRARGFPARAGTLQALLVGDPGAPLELDLRWGDGTITRDALTPPASESIEPETDEESEDLPEDDSKDPMRTMEEIRAAVELEFRGLEDAAFVDDGQGRYRVAILDVDTFDFAGTVEQQAFGVVLAKKLEEAGRADGIVVDLRGNPGGSAGLGDLLSQRFIRRTERGYVDIDQFLAELGPLWSVAFKLLLFEGRYVEWPIEPVDPIEVPIAALVDSKTGSAAEAAALILQRNANATIVGRRTAGAGAAIRSVTGRFGGTLRFGASRRVDHLGRDLQGVGVIPNVVISVAVEELRTLVVEVGFDEAVQVFGDRVNQRYHEAVARVLWRRLEERAAQPEPDAPGPVTSESTRSSPGPGGSPGTP